MKKVLVIEDDTAIRSSVIDLLDVEGFTTSGAENGLTGVRLAREQLPDLIICDIMMPGLNGYGVLDALRQDPTTATIPFIFLTAKADRIDIRQGMEHGADDYLTKPFTLDELLRAVRTRLNKEDTVSQKLQRKLDELRSSIAVSLPHELRTPLAGILTGMAILKDEYATLDPRDIRNLAEIAYGSAERLNRLVFNYLLYAELEVALPDTEMAKALLKNRTQSTQAIIAHTATGTAKRAGRPADLHLELQEATAAIAEDHLKKIVEELTDNALKYSEAGTPVNITTRLQDHIFLLSVTDNGRGMTPEQIVSVGAYMQFGRKIHEQQGSGLGLTIARRLAELYGGHIEIRSTPGQYTTVLIGLPT